MSPRSSRRCFVKTIAALPLLGASGSLNIHIRAAGADLPFATDNAKINQAREVALSVLKPTPKQLEHGLRLHAESLVFESYGFAPRAAVDGEKFKAVVESGASEAELTDLREEMLMVRWATDARERKEFIDAMRAAGVTCIFQNTGEEGSDPLRLIKRLARFTYATDLGRADCFKATQPDDIAAAKKSGKLVLRVGFSFCHPINGRDAFQGYSAINWRLNRRSKRTLFLRPRKKAAMSSACVRLWSLNRVRTKFVASLTPAVGDVVPPESTTFLKPNSTGSRPFFIPPLPGANPWINLLRPMVGHLLICSPVRPAQKPCARKHSICPRLSSTGNSYPNWKCCLRAPIRPW